MSHIAGSEPNDLDCQLSRFICLNAVDALHCCVSQQLGTFLTLELLVGEHSSLVWSPDHGEEGQYQYYKYPIGKQQGIDLSIGNNPALSTASMVRYTHVSDSGVNDVFTWQPDQGQLQYPYKYICLDLTTSLLFLGCQDLPWCTGEHLCRHEIPLHNWCQYV
jgi:hypothetical protein